MSKARVNAGIARAGNPHVEATGHAGVAGSHPVSTGGKPFPQAGINRAGSTVMSDRKHTSAGYAHSSKLTSQSAGAQRKGEPANIDRPQTKHKAGFESTGQTNEGSN